MKRIVLNYFVMAVIVVTSVCTSCNKEETVTTGVVGHIKYGKGDCMPVSGYTAKFIDYNGIIYFFDKDKWDNSWNNSGESVVRSDVLSAQFRKSSISANVKKGKLSVNISPGAYYVVPDEGYGSSKENT